LTRSVQGFNYISELTYRKSGDEMLDMHPNETPACHEVRKCKICHEVILVLFIFVMKIEQGS